MITIHDFKPEHQPYFDAFNRAWIEALFEIEPIDEWMLTNPEEAIIMPGGAILMAAYNGEMAGNLGLRKVDEHTYELIKMAVSEKFYRLGIAEHLCYASFMKGHQLGATKLILYANKRSANAIKLYEKIGFKHLPVEPGVYKRADVKMEIEMDEALKNYSARTVHSFSS